MWIVYRKSDRKVIGTTANADRQDPEKDEAIEEVVKNLAEPPAVSDLDAVQVSDRKKAQDLLQGFGRGRVRVVESQGKVEALEDEPDTAFLIASTDAKDFHPVDKVPLIPGDGRSFVRITVTKSDRQGAARASKTVDTDLLWLRTTNGTLRPDEESSTEIRSIRLAAGTATFRLYSEPAKRLATVQILTEDPNLNDTVVRVEFI